MNIFALKLQTDINREMTHVEEKASSKPSYVQRNNESNAVRAIDLI